MQKIRLYIKKHFPHLYQHIREVAFPIYLKLTTERRNAFTEQQTKRISCEGESFFITLNPKNGFVDTEIYVTGVYEPDILAIIKKHLPKGGTFIDIGSNIGQHALFAASVVGKTGTVLAFEPIPQLVEQLTKSIRLNNFEDILTVHPIACSNRAETVTLKLRPGNIGGSGLHHRDTTYTQTKIKAERADTYTANLPSIDIIKIDTEGHEIETLQGLAETLIKHKPKIIVEFSPSLREDEQAYKDLFLKLLQEHNYIMYDLEEGERLIKDPVHWANNFSKAQTNLLCCQQNS